MNELKAIEQPNNAKMRRMHIAMEHSFGVVCKTPMMIATAILELMQCLTMILMTMWRFDGFHQQNILAMIMLPLTRTFYLLD
jgi:hypothetical protein